MAGDDFAQLQAILAGLPMHAIPLGGSRSCGPELLLQCGGARSGHSAQLALVDVPNCVGRIQLKLAEVARDYPDHEPVLRRLVVEHASLDLVCFVDHEEERLFTAARGTDRSLHPLTTSRDVQSNVNILLGTCPGRAEAAVQEYTAVRKRFPKFRSFGTGHSLGGTVVLHVAKSAELLPDMSFTRIDVFNTATSPLTRSLAVLTTTAFHAHRVPGDWASWGLCIFDPGMGTVHTHEVKLHLRDTHALGHFLPDKANEKREPVVPLGPQELRLEEPRKPPWWTHLALLSCLGARPKAEPLPLSPGAFEALAPLELNSAPAPDNSTDTAAAFKKCTPVLLKVPLSPGAFEAASPPELQSLMVQ
ncbi:unnamed protein product [Polarella glacialis]|uniref:Fungal lipase-like domain-containing protein n=1 Tax=Polarella glacialis TaxID=89957 RepID=A0A813HDZ8_POLGL|nr:unnamed protein product [Polarella glacialis]CAE8665074.1 unnamed protein product [Polarella glacialis]